MPGDWIGQTAANSAMGQNIIEGVPGRGFYYLVGLRIRKGDSYARHVFWADGVANEEQIWAFARKHLGGNAKPAPDTLRKL